MRKILLKKKASRMVGYRKDALYEGTVNDLNQFHVTDDAGRLDNFSEALAKGLFDIYYEKTDTEEAPTAPSAITVTQSQYDAVVALKAQDYGLEFVISNHADNPHGWTFPQHLKVNGLTLTQLVAAWEGVAEVVPDPEPKEIEIGELEAVERIRKGEVIKARFGDSWSMYNAETDDTDGVIYLSAGKKWFRFEGGGAR